MRILVSGGDGLLAHSLRRSVPLEKEDDFMFLGHAEFDLTQPALMAERLEESRPDVVINTAAYNLVDRCEIERDLSWAINAHGTEMLAKLCSERDIPVVHYGTDYVFDGVKKSPYAEEDTPNPLNHYAAGKFAGEQAILHMSPRNLVLRTSWLFDWHPTQTKSFIHTILKATHEGRPIMATTNQVSVPTFASDLAWWTLELVHRKAGGLFHAVNDEGVSRFDWTKIILEKAARAKLISTMPRVEPVLSSFFNPAMRRPDYTVMSNEKLSRMLGRNLGSWRSGLEKMLAQMR